MPFKKASAISRIDRPVLKSRATGLSEMHVPVRHGDIAMPQHFADFSG
jgi:hypothetical protein